MGSIIDTITILDEALIEKLESIAFIGESTPTPIPIIYAHPEEEFVIESFPSIVLFRTAQVRDGQRITLAKFRDNYVYDNNGKLTTLDERESPLPINFLYTIRLYYEYNTDGAEMNLLMLKYFPPLPKPCFLTINNIDYDFVQISHALLQSGGENDFSTIKFKEVDERRIFCDQYFYFCEASLDIFTAETKKTVKEIIIDSQTT